MPLYEYQCESCGERFELLQKFSDPVPDTCTRCGKGPVHRLISSPAIQFKGSGWYVTDYAKKSGADAGKTAAPAPKASSATSSKSESSSSAATPSASAPANGASSGTASGS